MLAQLSWMSNADLMGTLAVIIGMFLGAMGFIALLNKYPAFLAVVVLISLVLFIGFPIVLFFVLAFAAGKNRQ